MGMGQGLRRIVTDRPNVAKVVVESLQFEEQAPEISSTSWHFQVKQRFDRLAVGETMADRRIAGHSFG